MKEGALKTAVWLKSGSIAHITAVRFAVRQRKKVTAVTISPTWPWLLAEQVGAKFASLPWTKLRGYWCVKQI